MGKETVHVIMADRQAPIKQKQTTTDHIDGELRWEIFKTSPIFVVVVVILEF